MAFLKLDFPVHTADNRLLLPAGAALSNSTLAQVISANKASSQQTCRLFKHATIKRDLLDLINSPPYDLIFSDKTKVGHIINMLENFYLPMHVLESLDYFKSANYYTYCHLIKVFTLSAFIARDFLPDEREWIKFVSTGPTHDIGKVCVPVHLLKKETPLTRAERAKIDHHMAAGYVMLSSFYGDHRHPAAVVARDHHERRDGSGLPAGIKLRQLMVETVIVCDIYDALISSRSYRPDPYDNRTAIEEISRLAEMKKIGWKAVKVLVALNRKAKPEPRQLTVSIEKRGSPPAHNNYGIFANGENGDTGLKNIS